MNQNPRNTIILEVRNNKNVSSFVTFMVELDIPVVENFFFAPHDTTLLAIHTTSTYYWFFWVTLFKTQNKLIFHSTAWIRLTWPMRSLLQEADSWSTFPLHQLRSLPHDIININIWIGLKQCQQNPRYVTSSLAYDPSSWVSLGKLWESWFGGPRGMFSKAPAV